MVRHYLWLAIGTAPDPYPSIGGEKDNQPTILLSQRRWESSPSGTGGFLLGVHVFDFEMRRR